MVTDQEKQKEAYNLHLAPTQIYFYYLRKSQVTNHKIKYYIKLNTENFSIINILSKEYFELKELESQSKRMKMEWWKNSYRL